MAELAAHVVLHLDKGLQLDGIIGGMAGLGAGNGVGLITEQMRRRAGVIKKNWSNMRFAGSSPQIASFMKGCSILTRW